MGRAGRLRKPDLTQSHGELNQALHTLHKEAGLMPLSGMVRALEGSGISRSTIYDAFSSTRLPAWHVVEALVEVLGAKHPRETPEKILSDFYDLWQSAIDEESQEPISEVPIESTPSPWFKLPSQVPSVRESKEPTIETPTKPALSPWFKRPRQSPLGTLAALSVGEDRIWLTVPFEDTDQVRNLGARWDPKSRRWYTDSPRPAIMKWYAEGPGQS